MFAVSRSLALIYPLLLASGVAKAAAPTVPKLTYAYTVTQVMQFASLPGDPISDSAGK